MDLGDAANGTADVRLGICQAGAQAAECVFFGVAHREKFVCNAGPNSFFPRELHPLMLLVHTDVVNRAHGVQTFQNGFLATATFQVLDFNLHYLAHSEFLGVKPAATCFLSGMRKSLRLNKHLDFDLRHTALRH